MLYKLKFKYIGTKGAGGSEWNGRDSDELCGFVGVQGGMSYHWEVTLTQLDYTSLAEKATKDFLEAHRNFGKAKQFAKETLNIEWEHSIPYNVILRVTRDNSIPTLIATKTYADTSEESDGFKSESVYIFVREGMSTTMSFSQGYYAQVSLPVKKNSKGSSVRAYAASLLNPKLNKGDNEFWAEIFEELKKSV